MIHKVVAIICVTIVGFVLSSPFNSNLLAEQKSPDAGKLWIGLYYGSEIPGFSIVKSYIAHVSQYSSVDVVLDSERSNTLMKRLADGCKAYPGGGVAVVNIRKIVEFGTVPGPLNSPTTMITNGMYIEYEGDCVTEVRPRN